MTTLTNKLVGPTGSPVVGAVIRAGLVGGPYLADGTAGIVRSASTVTAGDGTWSLQLTPTSQIEGTSYYVVHEDGQVWTVLIPNSGTVQLRAALTDPPILGVPTLGLTRAQADALYAPIGGGGGGLTQGQADLLYDPLGAAALRLLKTANLSDLANAATARTNLGARGSAERLTLPEQAGYIGVTLDPATCNSQGQPVSGSPITFRIYIPKAGTVSVIGFQFPTAGATFTAGQNFAGLYSDAGNLLSGSADQTANFAGTGLKAVSLTTPQAVAADSFVRAVILVNAGTTPQIRAGTSSGVSANLGLTGSAQRFGQIAGPLTALPASFDPSAVSTVPGMLIYLL